MKRELSPLARILILRLFLCLSLAAKLYAAWLIARHLHVPVEDALIGVILFTSSWTEVRLFTPTLTSSQETLYGSSDLLRSQGLRANFIRNSHGASINRL